MPAQHVVYASALADVKAPCVMVQFHGFANREQFQHIMSSGLAHHQAHRQPGKPRGWVGATRQMGAMPKEVQQWLVEDWNLRAYAAGIRETSVVVCENVLGQMATQQHTQHTAEQQERYELEPAYYDSLETAKAGAARRCVAVWAATK